MMRAVLVALALSVATPAAGEDRFSGYYTTECGRGLQCDLRIEPAGADTWHVSWAAIDPRDPSLTPVCVVETTVAIGTAVMGDVKVGGVAVGRIEGEAVAVFDLERGRVSVRTRAMCGGIEIGGRYEVVGD